MKLFIYEHITSGALIDQPLPPSLAHEGDAMLLAVIKDCLSLSDHAIHIIRDKRLALPETITNEATIHCTSISSINQYKDQWHKTLEDNDSVLVIAPETDDALQTLQRDLRSYQIQNLGCSTEAVALTGNKLKCCAHLTKAGINTPETFLASCWQSEKLTSAKGYVIKPIDGAGCINTYHFSSAADLDSYISQCTAQQLDKLVVQPYIEGDTISISLLFSAKGVTVLALNQQNIEQQQQLLSLKSCDVNGYENSSFSRSDASQLANEIKHAIPGLYGFVGIDIIVSEHTANVIDINPRLTTSYIGLAESLGINPMSLLLTKSEEAMLALSETQHRQTVNIKL